MDEIWCRNCEALRIIERRPTILAGDNRRRQPPSRGPWGGSLSRWPKADPRRSWRDVEALVRTDSYGEPASANRILMAIACSRGFVHLDHILRMSSNDPPLPPTLQSTLHPFTTSDALPSEPTHPFSNAEKPWSTLNDIFAATARISESLNAYLSFPLENTKLTSLLRQHTAASHSLNLVRTFPLSFLNAHPLTVVRQNKMLARPSGLYGRRSESGTAQTCRWTRWTP